MALVMRVGKIFHGVHPMVVGATLCDLVAMFFAGHNPDSRAELEQQWLDSMRDLTKINEKMLLEKIPHAWDKPPSN